MGMIKLSQKSKRPPVLGARYWADRGMLDFMPSQAWDVPVEGGPLSQEQLAHFTRLVYSMEAEPYADGPVGAHVEQHDQGYLTVTVGCFAT